MDRQVRSLQVELQTSQRAEYARRNVIQAIEPEAEHLLVEAGGKVLRGQEDYVYEAYWTYPWPTLIIFWPTNTRSAYVAPTGQEDGPTIFLAALLPSLQTELHLTYDYRFFVLFGSFEEFFTLRVAQMRIWTPDSKGEYRPHTR
jgi:hypothetical protein